MTTEIDLGNRTEEGNLITYTAIPRPGTTADDPNELLTVSFGVHPNNRAGAEFLAKEQITLTIEQ